MPKVLVIGESVPVKALPQNAAGGPSEAALKGHVYTSSDTSVFTVSDDSEAPTIKAVAVGVATLNLATTAVEPDGGATEDIRATDTITVVAEAPRAPVAKSIAFEYGDVASPVKAGPVSTSRLAGGPKSSPLPPADPSRLAPISPKTK